MIRPADIDPLAVAALPESSVSVAASTHALAPSHRLARLRRSLLRFFLQTAVWLILSLAIAAMLVVGRPFEFATAFRFSAATWMPWALITPLVFWVSGRFPIARGYLWRSIPLHLLACFACTLAAAWITMQLPFAFGPQFIRFDGKTAAPGQPGERIAGFTSGAVFPPFPGAGTVVFGPGGGFGREFLTPAGSVMRIQGDPPLLPPLLEAPGPITFAVPADPAALPPPDVPRKTPATGGYPAFNVPAPDTLRVSGDAPGPRGDIVMSTAPDGRMTTTVGVAFASTLRPAWWHMLLPLFMRANAGVAVYLIIACAAHAMAFYRQVQERERQSLALVASRNQAKLDALRLQLQPHFLFNTLNAISTLVHRDAHAADNLIGDLSDLLRVSLQTKAHEVTLARELELLGHYLAIEQARLGDRLRIRREVDPTTLAAYVPTLILQPLAENAIRHGIEPRLAPGTLTLRAQFEGGLLRLTVADDGVGFDPRAPGARHGIGLANSEERLRTLHDDRARLEVFAPASGGVRVVVSLPFRTEPAAPAPAGSAA